MSMNLYLTAETPSGQREGYGIRQTPTEITDAILAQRDPYQGYVRWLRETGGWNWKSPDDRRQYEEEKRHLRRWLRDHPNAKWERG